MTIYVFVGPTLSVEDASAVLDAVYLPPVQQGDIYRVAALLNPSAIGIIDGYFQQVPSVWHKEILWAMARGVHVFGSASMGALRAAELEPFGMQGVGRIFEAYRSGVFAPYFGEAFEDDDEVAVVHGPPETGYVAVSEAMVNIRCTLTRAEHEGVIGANARDALARLAKDHYYPDRSYDRLLARASKQHVPEDELQALGEWLGHNNRVNQKREDALAMLEAMRRFVTAEDRPKSVDYAFEHTTLWDRVMASLESVDNAESLVLDELRLEGEPYFIARKEALRHTLVLGNDVDEAFQESQHRDSDLDRRLTENHANPEEVDRLLVEQARLQALRYHAQSLPDAVVNRQIIAHLRSEGDYQRFADRSRYKQTSLTSNGAPPAEAALSGLQELQLRDWYFEKRLGRQMPDDLDGYIADFGFTDLDHFHRTLLCEFVYLTEEKSAAASE